MKLFNQPKPTISKEMADILDLLSDEAKKSCENENEIYSIFEDIDFIDEVYYSDSKTNIKPEFYDFFDFVKENLNLCIAYLSGKALDVDLIEVVEDEKELEERDNG